MVDYKDYYKIMGVSKDATQDEIKRAYRKLARKYHPDVSKEPDAEARFKEVGEAYEVLKDPEKRAAYDQLGRGYRDGESFRPPPNWDSGFEFSGGGFTDGGQGGFSDFFESLFGRGGFAPGYGGFGGRAQREFHARGEDTYARVLIDLEDAYHGATRTLTLKHPELGPDGRPQLQERTLNVRIPRGVRQGQHIRLARQGGAGIGKGEPGNLYLEIEFRPHPFYHVEGKDVFVDYAHTPDALKNVLQAARAICRGRLITVFGCGGDRDQTKRPLMAKVAAETSDLCMITSDNPRSEDPLQIVADILSGMGGRQGVHIEHDRAKAIEASIAAARPDDLILVAGKGHEDYQDIGGRRRPFSDIELVQQVLRGEQA